MREEEFFVNGYKDKKVETFFQSILIVLTAFLVAVSNFGFVSVIEAEGKSTKPLQGMVIGLDPGHQKKGNNEKEAVSPNSKRMKAKVTSGTAGKFTKVSEYQLNLTVGLKMKKKFESMGATVVMTREKNDVNISNIERAKLLNKKECDMVIRIHADGAESSKTNGYSILIPSGKDTVNIQKASKTFASALDKKMQKQVKGIRSRGLVERADLTGFNWSTVPVILLEMGFMSNESDDKIMQTEKYQEQLVNATAQALEEYHKSKTVSSK